MKSQKEIIFLSGDEVIDFKVLYCLYAEFSNIHIISNHEKSLLKYSRYKKDFVFIPWSDSGENQEVYAQDIKSYCDENNIEFIMTGGSNSVAFLDQFKDLFVDQKFFPVMSKEALEQIDNKWTCAQKLMLENISTPTTLIISDFEAVEPAKKDEITQKIGFPLIVKPVHGDGGLGVNKIDSFEELREHVLGRNDYNDLPLIIQDYIDGYDIDLSFTTKDGKILSYAVQRWIDEDTLEFCENDEVLKLGEKIITSFNYSGAGHFDMRIDNETGQVYVIECNPRFWRSVTAAMWIGLNFASSAVNSIMGEEYQKNGAMGHYTLPGKKIRALVKKPWSYFSLPKSDRNEISYLLKDPMPHLVGYFRG